MSKQKRIAILINAFCILIGLAKYQFISLLAFTVIMLLYAVNLLTLKNSQQKSDKN